MTKTRALFLDRDGVININHGYVYQKDNFDFIEGVFGLVKSAKHLGYMIIVVTNQAGIGRGYYSPEDFKHITDWMKHEFSERGASIDAVYFCPHHPSEAVGHYRLDCDCRKPKPGMILQAIEDYCIEPQKSVFIGDKASDMQAAHAAHIGRRVLFSMDDSQLTPKATEVYQYPDLTQFRL